ncbi:MAG: hypothetical protein ACR2MK_12500 [Solirubrobacteraceae bacterium]
MTPTQPVFYYDLGNPGCYLVAERIMSELAPVPEWEPVLGAALGVATAEPDRDSVGRQVAQLGLQPLRWPAAWPPDTEPAMLAATYAKRVGRAVAFSLAAFRQAFAGGRDLGDQGTVLIAAAACEMHPTAVLKAVGLRSVKAALQSAGERAIAAGARSLPAIEVGGEVFEGQHCIEQAGAALGARS